MFDVFDANQVMVGAGGVGKSATVIQFIQHHFIHEYGKKGVIIILIYSDPTIEGIK